MDQVESLLVVHCRQVSLCNAEPDAVGKALSEGTSSDLDAISVSRFRMTWRERVELTEILQVVQRQLEAKQVQQDVLKSATAVKVSTDLAPNRVSGTHAWLERKKIV